MQLTRFIAASVGLATSINLVTARECGCNTGIPSGIEPGKSVNLTIPSSSGVTPRKYRLHLPEDYDGTKELPLILSFHGRTQDAKYQEELSQFSNASYGFKGISVYPQGVPLNGKTPQWQGDPQAPSNINDVTFTLELINHLESTFCIDSSRIYAAGKSNGGGFTGLLACDPVASTRIAAFAPVAIPVPLMEFHGLKDTTAPYAGGLNTRGTDNLTDIITYVDDWAQRDGFSITANTTSTLCKGSKLVTKYAWPDETVVHYAYKNIAHDWPSSFANGDTSDLLTCKEAEATSIILKWLEKWTL